GDVFSRIVDDGFEVFAEQAAVQRVGAVCEEILTNEGMGAKDTDVGDGGVLWGRLDCEDEGGGESGTMAGDMGEEELVGLHGVRGEQEATGGGDGEVIGFF